MEEQQQNLNGTTSATQEVSSTTQVAEVTKRSIRVKTWKKIFDDKAHIGFNAVFNKIPRFVGCDKAAALLATTDEFKKATNVKVNVDRAQDPVKLEVLQAGKNLYLPPLRESSALFTKVNCPADQDPQKILEYNKEHRTEIDLNNKVPLDLVVVGSVCVSRDGYRIGRGNGFVDLDIGLLIECGAITENTVIATTVHDYQVEDNLPVNLFEKHDAPVDLIVTSTEVIRVSKRLPRPTGLHWDLVSERRLNIIPALRTLLETQKAAGKVIEIKSEDTDVEANASRRQQRRLGRRRVFRNNRRRGKSQTDNENAENNENNEDGEEGAGNRRPRRNKRMGRVRRRTTKSEGEQSAPETKENDNKNKDQKAKARTRKRSYRSHREFCVKISNISRGVRIKDLKTELRKRECNPVYISWKAQYGRCYLHFTKKSGQDQEVDIDKVLKSLNDLSLTVEAGDNTSKTVNLAVELLKNEEPVATENAQAPIANRIESVDTTTV